MIPVKRTQIRLKADSHKVIVKPLLFNDPARVNPVIAYIDSLSEEEVNAQLNGILQNFENRHYYLQDIFLDHFEKLDLSLPISKAKKLLIGAHFTHEYSTEASALFNPSIVPHPNQNHLKEGQLRFILSLRAVGEGHISSIVFQSGITDGNDITLDPRNNPQSTGKKLEETQLQKKDLLKYFDYEPRVSNWIKKYLPDHFTTKEAKRILESDQATTLGSDTMQILSTYFDDNYDIQFSERIPLGSRVLFPRSGSESNGMEDVRFVLFNPGPEQYYCGTYTAYNGRTIKPHLILTQDFKHFKIRALFGAAATNKGLAVFPEKVNGRYAMIGRQGGRNLSIMFSDDLYYWKEFEVLQEPLRNWEILQLGNCGSPIKTEHGWLLLTHAVGAMRQYVLSFSLLDLKHPNRIVASLDKPFMSPNKEEREGYVPNVLYTCGMLEHQGVLVIPYAMSDSSISFATVETKTILNDLLK